MPPMHYDVRYFVTVKEYNGDPLPYGVEVWDTQEDERDERYEKKFKTWQGACRYSVDLRRRLSIKEAR